MQKVHDDRWNFRMERIQGEERKCKVWCGGGKKEEKLRKQAGRPRWVTDSTSGRPGSGGQKSAPAPPADPGPPPCPQPGEPGRGRRGVPARGCLVPSPPGPGPAPPGHASPPRPPRCRPGRGRARPRVWSSGPEGDE